MPDQNDFVQNMLKSAKEKREIKPQSLSDDLDKQQIERITDNIMDKIKKKEPVR